MKYSIFSNVLIEHFQRDVQLSARNIAEEMSMHVINLEEEGGKFFMKKNSKKILKKFLRNFQVCCRLFKSISIQLSSLKSPTMISGARWTRMNKV